MANKRRDRPKGPWAGKHRFPIEQEVRYQCVTGSRISAAGTGKTLEISSDEIRFTTEQSLRPGANVRLAMDWPAKLDNTCFMKLEIRGSVVHSEAHTAAVKIARYEFRTRAPVRVLHSGAA
ncbi:MAG TPA: hypothetical protein VMT86_19885 [Bryobacteraceae bacterium]|nr:hypothetical protein [Bryobacteraceae bacterium]